jgi:hypothetical protein
MQPKDTIDPPVSKQANVGIRAKHRIAQGHIASDQMWIQLTKQRQFSFFKGRDSPIQNRAGGKPKQGHNPRDRETTPLDLFFVLRILPLIFLGIAHQQR